MALINCPECGREISDKASSCPNCGCPISMSSSVSITTERATTSNSVKKKAKPGIIIGLITLFVLLGAAIGAYILFLSPSAKEEKAYVDANALLASGQFEEALSRFQVLGNYKDSKEAISECNYQLGLQEQEKGNWNESIIYFEASSSIDSEDRIKESKYNLGINAMNSFDWETASVYFTGLSYKDSAKMLTDCSFMIDLKDSVLRRMEINAKEKSDLRTLVNTELAYLQSYKTASFYDKNISKQAKAYLEGLNKQLKAFDKEYEYEYQIAWQEGLVQRYEALNSLYKTHSFLTDNKDFVGTYIAQLSRNQDVLNGYYAIEKDLDQQYQDDNIYKKSGNTFILSLTNNTKYTFSSTWEWTVFDKNGAKIQTTPITVNDIKPGQSYEVRFTYSGAYGDIRFPNYYGEVKKGN